MTGRRDTAQMIGVFISAAGIVMLVVHYALVSANLHTTSAPKLEDLTFTTPTTGHSSVVDRDEVKEGDTVVVWKVSDIESTSDTLRIEFKGEAVITGQVHYLVRENGDQICMQEMNELSRSLIPSLKNDSTDIEVCFRNVQTAQKFLTPSDNGQMATVIIRDFEYVKNASVPAHTALFHTVINK